MRNRYIVEEAFQTQESVDDFETDTLDFKQDYNFIPTTLFSTNQTNSTTNKEKIVLQLQTY